MSRKKDEPRAPSKAHRIRAGQHLERRPHLEAREAVAALYKLWCHDRNRGRIKGALLSFKKKPGPSVYTAFVRERAANIVDRRKIWDYGVILRFLDEREIAPEDALKAIEKIGGLRKAADTLRMGASAKKTAADWESAWQELKALPAIATLSAPELMKGRYLLFARVNKNHVLSVRAAMPIGEVPGAPFLIRRAIKSRRKAGG